jgi:hypothetical protein
VICCLTVVNVSDSIPGYFSTVIFGIRLGLFGGVRSILAIPLLIEGTKPTIQAEREELDGKLYQVTRINLTIM